MELLKDSLRLITSCRCSVGCPDCVQVHYSRVQFLSLTFVAQGFESFSLSFLLWTKNVLCREYNEVLDKEAAIIILEVNLLLF